MKYDNTHLTLQDRQIIQKGIESRSSKTTIAQTIGKDPTTIAKEIRKHRDLKRRNAFNQKHICIHLKECHGCKRKCYKKTVSKQIQKEKTTSKLYW